MVWYSVKQWVQPWDMKNAGWLFMFQQLTSNTNFIYTLTQYFLSFNVVLQYAVEHQSVSKYAYILSESM